MFFLIQYRISCFFFCSPCIFTVCTMLLTFPLGSSSHYPLFHFVQNLCRNIPVFFPPFFFCCVPSPPPAIPVSHYYGTTFHRPPLPFHSRGGYPIFFIIIPLVHIFILSNLDSSKVFETLDPIAALVRCRSQHLEADSDFF